MQINRQEQYNQSISRYKLLSANAGVGSIITTTIGNYILISDIHQWRFMKNANDRILNIRRDADRSPEDWYAEAKRQINRELGLELVDDERFIEFLKKDKGLSELLCLAAIPHLSLNEDYNTININDNPTIRRLKEGNNEKDKDFFAIPGTHFPKWFRNDAGILKTYQQWKEEWEKRRLPLMFFAPPRDAQSPPYPEKVFKINQKGDTFPVYRELTQLNLVLICENGHLSDIPWSHYLRWRAGGGSSTKDGADLILNGQPCCDGPNLKWTESKNRSEGYASVYLECTNCGMGGEASGKKVNLEGINNLRPVCPGHKPWEISLEQGQDHIPLDKGCCDSIGVPTRMQVGLVTGNNVYFANTFSSLFVPIDLVKDLPEGMEKALRACNRKYEKVNNPAKTKEDWAGRYINEDLLDELDVAPLGRIAFLERLRDLFTGGVEEMLDDKMDLHEQYRRQEYKVFTRSATYHRPNKGLSFTDIFLPDELVPHFEKIIKVEELKMTSVQLDFTRVRPNERRVSSGGNVIENEGMNIFSSAAADAYILPAVENFGEGIFFQFQMEAVRRWEEMNEPLFEARLHEMMPRGSGFNGKAIRQKIRYCGARYLMIHTFSHLIMRELEFSCGYPTASLKERLYIAPDMVGVLIYTAEGSEGSMGGLIWQTHPERISELIGKALRRALDCSSDPLCWESDGQGLFNLNLAACFSCALVAETACEERNVALDRWMLIHPGLGFFKELLK